MRKNLHKVTQPYYCRARKRTRSSCSLSRVHPYSPGRLGLSLKVPGEEGGTGGMGGDSKWLSSSQECLYLVSSFKVLDTCPIDCHSLCFRAILDKKLAASVNILPKASSLWVLLWPVEGQILAGGRGTELMGNCERITQRHLVNQHFTVDLYSKEVNHCFYVILWTKAKICCVVYRERRETPPV